MRFSAPRSVSPSPDRGQFQHRNSFGLPSDSDSEDYLSEIDSSFEDDNTNADNISVASSSSSSFNLVSDVNKLSIRPRTTIRNSSEEREIEETVAAIRVRTRYHDPYEEWEQETRKDAVKSARKEFSLHQKQFLSERERLHEEQDRQSAERQAKSLAEAQFQINAYLAKVQEGNERLLQNWKARDKALWDQVEAAIRMEEEKYAKKLEEERREREETERKQKEAELKRRLEEEKRVQEETRKKKEEDERLQREKEEEDDRRRVQEEKEKLEKDQKGLRIQLGLNFANDDWKNVRQYLRDLKSGPIAFVKREKSLKAELNKLRRQITPKIGQLTNDVNEINRITQHLIHTMKETTTSPHQNALYPALASALAKAILLQAETEVLAEKKAAGPLAQVTYNLLQTLPQFGTILYAKMFQRCGPWVIPTTVPTRDVDGKPWASAEEFQKVSGWRKSNTGGELESADERCNRIAAVMRVYFHVIKLSLPKTEGNLDPMFQLSRYWVWFARIMNEKKLLGDSLAAQLIYTGLDVLGLDAVLVYGDQWVKTLAMVHEGIANGYEEGKLIGGNTTTGSASRMRVKLVLENIVKGT